MHTLLDQKYDKLFGLLDADGDGVITYHDFEQMADRVLAAFPEGHTSAKGKRYAQEMTNYWNALREAIDTDHDGQISKDEFRQALHQVSTNFDTLVEPLYRTAFRLADTDDDGLVSKQEFIAAEVAIGVPAHDAEATFDRLTEPGAQLTMDTLVTAITQFYRDDSPADAEHYLFFGKL